MVSKSSLMIPGPRSKPSTGPPLSLEDHAANAAKSIDTNLGSLDRAVELGTRTGLDANKGRKFQHFLLRFLEVITYRICVCVYIYMCVCVFKYIYIYVYICKYM